MNELLPELKDQIDKEAEKYGFRVPYDGSTDYYNEDRVKGYQDGAKVYALKWQETEEMKHKMAEALVLVEMELKSMYKRLGFKGSNVLDLITAALSEWNGKEPKETVHLNKLTLEELSPLDLINEINRLKQELFNEKAKSLRIFIALKKIVDVE